MHVELAEVHHKDFAGRSRSYALEGFVEGGNSLAGTEASNHSHLQKVSSRTENMRVVTTLLVPDIAAVGLPIHLDPD